MKLKEIFTETLREDEDAKSDHDRIANLLKHGRTASKAKSKCCPINSIIF